jgi:hypothetical protein
MQYYAIAMTVLHFDVIFIKEASHYYVHTWIYVIGTEALDIYELFLLGHDSMLFHNFLSNLLQYATILIIPRSVSVHLKHFL